MTLPKQIPPFSPHHFAETSLQRAGFAILCGPQGYLYSVELLVPDQLDTVAPAYLTANRPSILFALGIKCLWLAFQNRIGRK